MATRLTDKALAHLRDESNEHLRSVVCRHAGINSLYAMQAILRKSRALTTWKAVEAIALNMGITDPELILEEDTDTTHD